MAERVKVTVGLPVFNGEAMLERSISALVQQNYPHLEILISDNASIDGTWNLIQSLSRDDRRIKVFRQKENIGAIPNFEFLAARASGEYFMWAAADDSYSENFITEAVQSLECNPRAVMANAQTILVDPSGNPHPNLPTRPPLVDLSGKSLAERIGELAARVGWCIYGLLRTDIIKQILPLPRSQVFDVMATYQLACLGDFTLIPNASFYYTINLQKNPMSESALGINGSSVAPDLTSILPFVCSVIMAAPASWPMRIKALHRFVSICTDHEEWRHAIASESAAVLAKNRTIRFLQIAALAGSLERRKRL